MSNPRFNLAGRKALITGSSRGIGRGIALALAEAGADVAVHCTNANDIAHQTYSLIAGLGRRHALIEGDLSAENTGRLIFDQTIAALGGIDILILNASVQIPKDWRNISGEDVARQVAVNYRSSLELLQLCVPGMIERQWGRIISVGSVQEKKPNPEMLVYSSLKNAQTAMVLSLAKILAPHGITANNIAPGVIETDRYRERVTSPEIAAKVLSWIPMQSLGQAEDCAGAALLFCSEAGRYITGQNLFIDGGMSL